ncbi:MAG: PAS domain S-box protein [Novosphingobium sp.]|nr:PAS domain S-box protein [Novosphingobium sp.]
MSRVEKASDIAWREPELFRTIIEAMPNPILVIDRERQIRSINRKAEELFRYDRDELIGRTIETLVPERFRTGHPELVHDFFDDPSTRPMGAGRELFGRRQDGSEFPVEIGLNPFELEGETCTLASIVDITERRRAQAVHDRLAWIVDSSDDAIISMRCDGTIATWNPGAEKLYGYPAEEVIGQSVLMLAPEEAAAEQQRLVDRMCSGEIYRIEAVRRRKDGSLVDISASLSPLKDRFGRIVGGSSIVRDISESKRQEEELRRSNAELEQFAYVASHDLQEPLRMVANYVELLADRYRGQLDERADKYIAFAVDGARRMQRLVSDLLAYSRVGSEGKPLLAVSTETIVDQVVHGLHRLIQEHEVLVDYADLPRVMADEVQLGQLFQNLVSNAIKFRGDEPPVVRISAARRGREWQFTVADNGIGIDMKYAERVFQMFQRLHERSKYEGSGIGLAIAKRIVERHGGRIWVESTPGTGSTFHFTLRAATGEKA